jgi:GTP pyrophosphokinase
MKTEGLPSEASAIVRAAENPADREDEGPALARARAFAEPLLAQRALDSGEDSLAHADGTAAILRGIGAPPSLQAAVYLVYAADVVQRPEEVVLKAFGPSYASVVSLTRKLVAAQRAAGQARWAEAAQAGDRPALRQVAKQEQAEQLERVRKMLLAFSRDLRVVLLRLASRLQSLRWFAQSKQSCPPALAEESLHVFAPLANRLGLWQLKWELEDLAFRFTQPAEYKRVAALLDETRIERERGVAQVCAAVAKALQQGGVAAQVSGRPKHLYSIWKKMQGKRLAFARVFDVTALRVVVADVPACYAALSVVHAAFEAVPEEFDDYIARPKPNGYQSLHSVVVVGEGRPMEVQIRTAAMHEHAESGVAAHWAYKEAGTRGYAGVSAAGRFESQVAEARKNVLRQLLAWERDLAQPDASGAVFEDRVYVFTPQAAVVELPAGATAIDFAYALHTTLGHRCRGAKIDGVMRPLSTALHNGQTVEIIATKEGGPSLDWLNAELGYLQSARAKAKVRAWFNAQAQAQTAARGREALEKLLQREGRTAVNLEELARSLGFGSPEALFEVLGKDELPLRQVEQALRPPETGPGAGAESAELSGRLADEHIVNKRRGRGDDAPSQAEGVLVVGIDSLLTNMARCCRPAPPDAIGGFVTRGKGVAIHRRDCSNFRHMAQRSPQRVTPVAWSDKALRGAGQYTVELLLEVDERAGLLRDVSEALAKERLNLVGVQMQKAKGAAGAFMVVTAEVDGSSRLAQALALAQRVAGVRSARRK